MDFESFLYPFFNNSSILYLPGSAAPPEDDASFPGHNPGYATVYPSDSRSFSFQSHRVANPLRRLNTKALDIVVFVQALRAYFNS